MILTRLLWATPVDMLRAGCVALSVCVSACGGGGDATPPLSAVPTLVPIAAPSPAPGTTLSIDSVAGGNPVSLRVALSANGDGFAVWQAHDGTRHNLWANRYYAATAAWESPTPIEATSADIGDFDLTVDASGNAVLAWHEAPPGGPSWADGVVMSVRFNAGAGAWAAPVLLNAQARQPRVASNATGDVLAVYVVQERLVVGRFFDPVGGTWLPEAAIEQNHTGTGYSTGPVALLDGSGNALAAWENARISAAIVASNYFSLSTGGWGQLPPYDLGPLGGVPDSFSRDVLDNVQLATATDGNFLVAWGATQSYDHPESAEIYIARFMSGTRTWSAAQTLMPSGAQNIRLQRLGSNAGGKALLLWTETVGTRTALKAVRVDDAGAACSAVQVIDSAVGGGAARADLGVDPQGHAIAIWQQFEGGNPDDGSRSNIAINRFDGATGTWAGAVLAETQPGNAISPRASATGGQALLVWLQAEDGANRVKALLQPLADTSP